MAETIKVEIPRTGSRYDVRVGGGILGDLQWLLPNLRSARTAVIGSNRRVWELYGPEIKRGIRNIGLEPSIVLIGDGERFKNIRSLQMVVSRFAESGLTRSDAVFALGGGVVGDLAGFATSIYQRGLSFVNVPTTLLAMVAASVGGKTGINTGFGKNQLGTFFQPTGVVVDVSTIKTLPSREVSCGLWEAVKQGSVAGWRLFDRTAAAVDKKGSIDPALIALHIRFKTSIIAKDEQESPGNVGPRSRKILNFGHTFAHALEKAANYRGIKHGEAVGYGILFAAELAKKLEFLDRKVVKLLYDVVHRAGELPPIAGIDPRRLSDALRSDKKSSGGVHHWVLLKDIGKPMIVPHTEIPTKILRSTIDSFISN